jgi:hypothetical protein
VLSISNCFEIASQPSFLSSYYIEKSEAMPAKYYHPMPRTSSNLEKAENRTLLGADQNTNDDVERQNLKNEELDNVSLEGEARIPSPRQHRITMWFSTHRFLIITILIAAIAISGILATTISTFVTSDPHILHQLDTSPIFNLSPSGLSVDCGTTNREARGKGCVFDLMVYGWTPPACYEEDIASEALSKSSQLAKYAAAGEFPWYAKENYTDQLPQDTTILSEYPVIWATNGWHQAHCLYFWQLLARSVERGSKAGADQTYVLSEALLYSHTYHCNKVLAAKIVSEIDEPVIKTLRIYGRCVKLDSTPDPYLEHGDFVPVLGDALIDT